MAADIIVKNFGDIEARAFKELAHGEVVCVVRAIEGIVDPN